MNMTIAVQPHPSATPPPPFPMRRFTVDEYHEMIQQGILTEDDDVELLEGWIVNKMAKNPPHEICLRLTELAIDPLIPAGWHRRSQSVVTTFDSEPEPDYIIVSGSVRDYGNRHPGPSEIALLIEVSHSTLDHDRGFKRRLYARAGIPIYWIINLVDRQIG
jgi:Uma2 family endonuclease